MDTTTLELVKACKMALDWINNAIESVGQDAMLDAMPNNCRGRYQLRDAIDAAVPCKHSPTRQYSWFASDALGDALCVGCLDCGETWTKPL